MTRDNEVVIKIEPRQQSLLRAQSGKYKAAKMTISVVFDKWGVNNERWARTLQAYSDYLIRY